MKPEELSIGDWVNVLNYHYDGSPYVGQVDGISKRHGTYYLQFGSALSAEIDMCEPIPITPEILEKNGFRLKEESDSYKEYIAGDELCIIVLYFYKETIYGVSTLLDCERGFAGGLDRIHKCNLLYVHQLQHALRLCGIPKTIELTREEQIEQAAKRYVKDIVTPLPASLTTAFIKGAMWADKHPKDRTITK